MRLVVLAALFICLGGVLLLGFLQLIRELLTKSFFQSPSVPDAAPDSARDPAANSSRSASPMS